VVAAASRTGLEPVTPRGDARFDDVARPIDTPNVQPLEGAGPEQARSMPKPSTASSDGLERGVASYAFLRAVTAG